MWLRGDGIPTQLHVAEHLAGTDTHPGSTVAATRQLSRLPSIVGQTPEASIVCFGRRLSTVLAGFPSSSSAECLLPLQPLLVQRKGSICYWSLPGWLGMDLPSSNGSELPI